MFENSVETRRGTVQLENYCKPEVCAYSTVDQAIQELTSNYFKIELEIVLIIDSMGATKGVSGDPVYRIFESNGTTLMLKAIGKAFLKEKTFKDELIALNVLKRLSSEGKLSQKHGMVEVYDTCTVQVRAKKIHLMLQSVAQGEGLDDHLKACFSNYTNAELYKNIISSAAEAFATLHKNTESNNPAITENYSKSIDDMLGKLSSLNHCLESVSNRLHSCESKIRRLIKRLSDIKEFGTIIHGDSHPGNIFALDSQGEIEVTFIDTPSLACSLLDRDNLNSNEGKLPKMRDYSNFLVRMGDIYIRQGVSRLATPPSYKDDRCRDLRKQFKNRYWEVFLEERGASNKIHKHLLAIRSLLGTIFRCSKIIDARDKTDDEFKESKMIAKVVCSEIERIANKYGVEEL